MSEEDSSQEKTEEATPKRLEKAKEEGQTARSREFTTTAVLLAGTVGLFIFGGEMSASILEVMRASFSLSREEIFDPSRMLALFASSFFDTLWAALPLFVVLLVSAILGPLALGGWLFSGKSLLPKLNRLDPLKGLQRMFSVKALIELVKSIAKVLVVIGFTAVALASMQDAILGLNRETIERGVMHSVYLSAIAAIIISASTIVISAIDIPFQIYDHAKKLRMSKQDVKDEMKDTEGKPEVKSKIRQLQQEMSQRRMMEAVPDADVVITNPTHFSVALKYDPDSMDTPILLAKGVDLVALRIREVAKANNIEFVEAPVLARAIYHTTELEDKIPHGLYVAVAQVLAYVFQLRDYRKGRGDRPDYPRKLDIPPDMSSY